MVNKTPVETVEMPGLALLRAEMAALMWLMPGLALVVPGTAAQTTTQTTTQTAARTAARTEADIEADFDNMPV